MEYVVYRFYGENGLADFIPVAMFKTCAEAQDYANKNRICHQYNSSGTREMGFDIGGIVEVRIDDLQRSFAMLHTFLSHHNALPVVEFANPKPSPFNDPEIALWGINGFAVAVGQNPFAHPPMSDMTGFRK